MTEAEENKFNDEFCMTFLTLTIIAFIGFIWVGICTGIWKFLGIYSFQTFVMVAWSWFKIKNS